MCSQFLLSLTVSKCRLVISRNDAVDTILVSSETEAIWIRM